VELAPNAAQESDHLLSLRAEMLLFAIAPFCLARVDRLVSFSSPNALHLLGARKEATQLEALYQISAGGKIQP
jgi:hypothetical protein